MRNTLRSIICSIYAMVFIGVISSCEKTLLSSDPGTTPSEVFEYLWDDIQNRYAYFELKQIDWKAVKERYVMEVDNNMSEHELFDVLAEMLFELEDGHVNLTSPFNRSRNWEWQQNYPLNYNQGIIDRKYLGKDFYISGPLRHQLIDSVLYVNYRSFTESLRDDDIAAILHRAQNAKGVIIDVRSNGGGAINNAFNLAGAFTDQSYTYGKVRIKNGPCSDCFSSWTDLRVPARTNGSYSGTVVVLTNRSSYSSTTYFAEMMRQNPRAILVGNTTGGGGGSPVFGELPNGWVYRFSSTQALTLDDEHFESGIPVDVEVDLDQSDEAGGKDTILESALQLLQ
ncbi:MAG: S41 family peptidase [Cryomorphaceae bacterium]|nr:S41 family peptidase [Cryomorphaceae bacterium]